MREAVVAADRRRRVRESSRQVWRMAPLAGGASLCLAGLSRWAGLPAGVPVVVLVAGTCALVAFALTSRRRRPVSDLTALAIDAEAGLNGELRSANWFAQREARDSWAEFHLGRAAEKLQRIDWTELYPRTRAGRAKLTTVVFAAATLAMTITMPERAGVAPTASASTAEAAPAAQKTPPGRVLDPELQRRLEELLAKAAKGDLPAAEALAGDAEMRDLLDRLNQLSDAELMDALKRALEATADGKAAADNLKKLADQARRSPDIPGGLPKELQDALEKLSDEIEIAQSERVVADDSGEEASGGPQQAQPGESGKTGAGQELSIQFAKAAEASGGAGVMMMSSGDDSKPGGAGGAGVGGSGGEEAAAAAAAIEAALTKETVEASQDTAGKNIETEIRRETERGSATVGFTGSASGSFDRTRAAAPPPVPEARRPGVQTYFVRKP